MLDLLQALFVGLVLSAGVAAAHWAFGTNERPEDMQPALLESAPPAILATLVGRAPA
ncbi:hypothetical protein GXW71_34195 [Roseomonas hellenica]|uniref:Uncharacterized protein n=1 Tax=Plastoroseomonas hellenica TaxID=2687306 RepID=A0ABS5FA65_9PROT|nr:hypothetical protein [Plastoroseomonas hellenica]MBR0669445.1 hypothetical protein [Plastoroseomonas hellenica]